MIYALTAGPMSGWGSAPVIVIAGIVGVGSFVALVPVERRIRAPMLRLSLFASRQFDAINVTTLLFYGALSAAGYVLVLQFELRLGYSAAQAGAAADPGVGRLPGAVADQRRAGRAVRAAVADGERHPARGRARTCGWRRPTRARATSTAVLPPALLRGVGLGLR